MSDSKVDLSGLNTKFKQMLSIETEIMKKTLAVFVDNTPIKTGHAKRSTKLKSNVIEADYGYAFVLDEGRKRVGRKMQGSNQAPKGMTKPTIKEMSAIVKSTIKKVVR